MKKELPRYINVDTLLFEKMDDQFSKITLRVAHEGLNNNKTFFTKPSLEYMAQTIIGKPIIGRVNEKTGLFEGHNTKRKIVNGKMEKTFNTRPYGFIPESSQPRFETFETQKGPIEYLVVDGLLWNRYPEAIKAFELNNGEALQSMELHMNHSGYRHEGIYYFEEASVTGLCLLGPDKTTGMVETVATLFEMDEELQKEFETLKEEYEIKEGTEMPTLEEVKAAAKKQIESQLGTSTENTEAPEAPEVTETEETTEETTEVEETKVEETEETKEDETEEETTEESEVTEVKETEEATEVEETEALEAPEAETTEVTTETNAEETSADAVKFADVITEFTSSELYAALPDSARKAINVMIEKCQSEVRYLEACMSDIEAEKQRYATRMDNEKSHYAAEKAKYENEIAELQGTLTTYEAKEIEAAKDAKLEELKPVLDVEEFESLETNRAELTIEEMEAAAAQFVLDRAKKLTYEADEVKAPTVKTRSTKTPKKQQNRYGSLSKYLSSHK